MSGPSRIELVLTLLELESVYPVGFALLAARFATAELSGDVYVDALFGQIRETVQLEDQLEEAAVRRALRLKKKRLESPIRLLHPELQLLRERLEAHGEKQ